MIRRLSLVLAAAAAAALPATASATTLPGGRVYEQVTPVAKGGAQVVGGLPGNNDPVAVSTDGNSLLWDTAISSLPAATAPFTASPFVNSYVFTRSPTGTWSPNEMLPPDNLVVDRAVAYDLLVGVTPDLSTSFDQVFNNSGQFSGGAGPNPGSLIKDLVEFDPATDVNQATGVSTPTVLTRAVPTSPDQTAGYSSPVYVGSSASGDHAVYGANASFPVSNGTVPVPASANADTFLYDETAAGLDQVAITPGGVPFADGVVEPSAGGIVSTDGSKIFFEASGGAGNLNEGLFVRESHGISAGVTLPISIGYSGTAAGSTCATHVNTPAVPTWTANFEGATPDGSIVFFTSDCALTSTSNTGGGTTPDLYAYNLTTGTMTDLSVAGGSGADVLGLVGYSNAGLSVYFVADGVLPNLSGASHGAPTAGSPNLYLSQAGSVTFLATLASADSAVWTPAVSVDGDGNGAQTAVAQVTPDGGHLLISSAASLSSYAAAGKAELYEFSARGGAPTCVSCQPAGTAPTGSAVMAVNSLQSDGARAFFTTPDALVPADANTVDDVYEYDASAQPASSDTAADPYGGGSVSLLSGGATLIGAVGSPASLGSAMLGASTTGTDVYFETRDQLVAQDEDDSTDVYDARVGGVSPPPPATSLQCASQLNGSCQAAPTAAPTLPTPVIDTTGTNVTTTVTRSTTTTTAVVPTPSVSLSLTAVTAKQAKADAKSGQVVLKTSLSAASTASAVAIAVIAGKKVTVAETSGTLHAKGSLTLTLRLSAAARQVLARGRSLRVTITIAVVHGLTHSTSITLKR